MSDFDDFRKNYMRASFLQAKEDGKIPQWIFKQLLFWLLRFLFRLLVIIPIKFLLIVPIKLIWTHSGRKDGIECDGTTHFLRFLLFTVIYFCFLGGILCGVFNLHK